MHVRTSGTRPEVHLRRTDTGEDVFTQMTRVLGIDTDAARAQFVGCSERTIRRVRQGVIGEEFMARAVAALRRHEKDLRRHGLAPSLDGIFRIVDVPVAGAVRVKAA